MSKPPGFIDKHGLWTDEQKARAEEIKRRLATGELKYIRLAWGDTHGYSRAKTLTVPAFLSALTAGHNIGVATTTLDSAGARVFASFTRGGGMGLDEMTGSPNLTVVPDPATFRTLPWAPGVGWILCDEYFNDGRPFPFATRQLLRKALRRLGDHGYGCVVGAEIEWYLLRVAEDHLTDEHVGVPGTRGRPIRTWPAEPGYHYHSESNLDLMEPVLGALGDAYEKLGLDLRSIENEWGPGQVECTFAPRPALEAADNVLLFRTATRQICRRLGYFATFMCRPALKGYYASGWHLHQSVVDAASGVNRFMPDEPGEALSRLGRHYLAGLLAHAREITAVTNQWVNSYKRLVAGYEAPVFVSWARNNRSVVVNVPHAQKGHPDSTRIEYRAPDPVCNPYLAFAATIAAGLHGIDKKLKPPKLYDGNAYEDPKLRQVPKTLREALDELERSKLAREAFGETVVKHYLHHGHLEQQAFDQSVTDWELMRLFERI